VLLDFFTYFQELTAARRAHPTEDMASAIANAVVDGQPLNDVETMSYYVIIATAGHDTTSSTIAGGLRIPSVPQWLDCAFGSLASRLVARSGSGRVPGQSAGNPGRHRVPGQQRPQHVGLKLRGT
jgi:hypothetical protein